MKIKGLTIPTFIVILMFTLACKENEDPLIDVNFEYSDSLVLEGTSISFKDLSQGKPTEWSWNFEGGNPEISTIQNPIVTYNNSGEFSVSLFASNRDNSDFKVMNRVIKVFKKIEPAFSFIPSVNVGDQVSFQDISTGHPTSWNWSFNNGAPATSQAQNPTISFMSAGLHEVTLTASNGASTESLTSSILVLPANGLILNYKFNGNILDESENQNHGQVVGATLTNDRNGNLNSAYYFDGLNDEIRFPFSGSFLNLPYSISCWIYFESLKPAVLGNDVINNQQSGVWLSIGIAPETLNRLGLSIGNGGTPSPNSRRTFVADKILEVGKWYHVVGIVENINSMKIYIDNQLITGFYTGFADVYYHSANSGSLGRVWDTSSFFHGKLDNIRIYNRPLTSNEVSLFFQEP